MTFSFAARSHVFLHERSVRLLLAAALPRPLLEAPLIVRLCLAGLGWGGWEGWGEGRIKVRKLNFTLVMIRGTFEKKECVRMFSVCSSPRRRNVKS